MTGEPPNSIPGDEALDPELYPIIAAQRLRAQSRPSLEQVTPPEMRIRASAEFAAWNDDPEPVALVQDLNADGVPARLYDPNPDEETAILVYCHGGGWVIGDLDLEDAALRRMAARSGVAVLSVDYRLCPEHPFPAPLEDVEKVMRWVAAGHIGGAIDPTRIGLGGASAGANLALGTALRLRAAGGPMPRFLLLMYGAYAGGMATESYEMFGDGRFGLPRAAMDWFWTIYAGADPAARDPQAVPLAADLAGLPPAFVNHAELDILRDDSVALVARLREAGVEVEHRAYAGAVHGFTQYAKGSALARRALDEAADAVAAALN